MESIDWFGTLPKQDRAEIIKKRAQISPEARKEMLTYGKEYFDGGSPWGYGGYVYDGRFERVVARMVKHYGLTEKSRILEVGCAKAYLLYEFYKAGITDVYGIDVSDYAISQVPKELQGRCFVTSADDLSRWDDKSVDLIISKDVIHNLSPEGADRAIAEMARVSKGHAFVQLGAYRTESQKECLKAWIITIKTVRSVDEWVSKFQEFKYPGDYHFICHDYKLG